MAGLKRQQAEFLNGVPELVVLRLLASREMYGYEIVNEIRKTSDQVLTFGEGVIYPMLHSLEKKKYLGTRRVMVNGRPRIYYRVTARGKKQLATSIAQWQRVTHAVQQVLEGVRGEAAMP